MCRFFLYRGECRHRCVSPDGRVSPGYPPPQASPHHHRPHRDHLPAPAAAPHTLTQAATATGKGKQVRFIGKLHHCLFSKILCKGKEGALLFTGEGRDKEGSTFVGLMRETVRGRLIIIVIIIFFFLL